MKKKPKELKPQIALKRTPSSRASTASTASPSKWIRTEKSFSVPTYVRDALQRLNDAGFVAYLVGGSVRDFLLKRESKDHDIATNATPDQLCELFPEAVTVGKAFGVLKIPLPARTKQDQPEFLEIATFREDLEYQDYRRPKGIRFVGPEEDAQRRDFTINALFYDPKISCILDPTGGLQDLKNHCLRAIGEPNERFKEDALRLLRAIRFETTLGFALEEKTEAAIRGCSKLISHVSAERIREELTLMFTGPHVERAMLRLAESGLLRHVLPEVDALRKLDSVWRHLLRTLRFLDKESAKRSFILGWAAVLMDTGKSIAWMKNQGKNFNGHETEAARQALSIGFRLKMAREEVDQIVAIVQDQLKFRDVFKMREATLLRFLRQPHFEELLALHQADALATDGNLSYYEFCASRLELLKKTLPDGIPKLIDGKDLIQLGFNPGPEFSQILREVEDLALERKIQTKEEALEYVIHRFVR